VSVLPESASSVARNRGMFAGSTGHIVEVGSSRHQSRNSLSRTTTNRVEFPAISPSIQPGFRAAARLPFVCLSKRKEAKEKTPDTAPAMPVHSDARDDGMRPELGPLWRPSNSWPHRCNASDTRRHCTSASPRNGTEYKLPTLSIAGPRCIGPLGRSAEQRSPAGMKQPDV